MTDYQHIIDLNDTFYETYRNYFDYSHEDYIKFFDKYSFIMERVRERRKYLVLFNIHYIYVLYYLVYTKLNQIVAKWPFLIKDLELIYSDLGICFPEKY
jgi:hypothetical protein